MIKPWDKQTREVLVFCNSVRAKMGKRARKTLAKGDMACISSCVIAATIGDVKTSHWATRSDNMVFGHTHRVRMFIKDFDKGSYPRLEK